MRSRALGTRCRQQTKDSINEFNKLDDDLGLSKGLAGLAENLVKFLANLAAAPVIGALQGVSTGLAPQGTGGAGGIVGMMQSLTDNFGLGNQGQGGQPGQYQALNPQSPFGPGGTPGGTSVGLRRRCSRTDSQPIKSQRANSRPR